MAYRVRAPVILQPYGSYQISIKSLKYNWPSGAPGVGEVLSCASESSGVYTLDWVGGAPSSLWADSFEGIPSDGTGVFVGYDSEIYGAALAALSMSSDVATPIHLTIAASDVSFTNLTNPIPITCGNIDAAGRVWITGLNSFPVSGTGLLWYYDGDTMIGVAATYADSAIDTLHELDLYCSKFTLRAPLGEGFTLFRWLGYPPSNPGAGYIYVDAADGNALKMGTA